MSDAKHEHAFVEIGRVFAFSDDDADPAVLSPEGLHDPKTGQLVSPEKMSPSLRSHFESKIPELKPHVILQCADADCKHIVHADLTAAEAKALQKAFDSGSLDPDGNGTNRLLSQASLQDLGLARIAEKLADPQASGAREALVEAS